MDEIATKAIIIGVSIFVTLIIVTVIVFEFTEISKIYKATGETNITFEDRLDEFNKYRDKNNDFNGLDVKNTLAKYKNNKLVDVCIGESDPICNDSIKITEDEYINRYSSTLIEQNGKYKIKFVQVFGY